MINPFYNSEEQRVRSGWRLLLQIFLVIAAGMLLMLPFSLAGVLDGADQFAVIPTLITALAALAGTWGAGRLLDRRGFVDFGHEPVPEQFRELGFGLLAGLAAMAIIFALEYSAGWITVTGYGWERPFTGSWVAAFLGFLVVMLLVGYYEELVFRGYQILNLSEGLRGTLGSRSAVVLAVAVSSIVFGVLHAWNANATSVSTFNIVLAGAVLAVPYVVTGRLGWSVGLHISWNFCQAGIFGFPVSGTSFRGSLLQIEQGGRDLITGGAFGPEAGLLGILGLLVILSLFYLIRRRSGLPITLASKFSGEPLEATEADEQGS
ncbi:MAG: type II CAAX endopeptidase family protein [Balneolaceae bacterium]|nr:type II CAAX endopeptidase family protein [Balneolaceae bacterium]